MSPQDAPEEGEYVIGRVIEVKDFGATLNLLEFSERKAFVHISEVASGWVKYIRDFIREGQMVVAKVTKVKESKRFRATKDYFTYIKEGKLKWNQK